LVITTLVNKISVFRAICPHNIIVKWQFMADLDKTPSLKTEMHGFVLLSRNSHFTQWRCVLLSPPWSVPRHKGASSFVCFDGNRTTARELLSFRLSGTKCRAAKVPSAFLMKLCLY